MQVHHEQSREEQIRVLQQKVDDLELENHLLQDQLARKEQFVAMIAHELRSPLTPIINYAQMIVRQQNGQPGPALLRSTRIIISQARRLTRLVNDLLDASRLSSGQFTLLREQCDLVALATEVVEQLRPLAPYHKLVITVPDTPIQGNWDSCRLQQALGNLLDNAIKYSDEETTITVHLWTEQTVVHVSVHNQGASIPSAEIGRLFHPYVRLQSARSRQGSGLGLYITRCIIEAHDGVLRLEPHLEPQKEVLTSEGPKGTTFSFELPLA